MLAMDAAGLGSGAVCRKDARAMIVRARVLGLQEEQRTLSPPPGDEGRDRAPWRWTSGSGAFAAMALLVCVAQAAACARPGPVVEPPVAVAVGEQGSAVVQGARVRIAVDPVRGRLDVEARFEGAPDPLVVQMPEPWAPGRSGARSRDFEARCDGERLPVEVQAGGRASVGLEGCASPTILYAVELGAGGGEPLGERLDAARGLRVFGQSALAVPEGVAGGVGVEVVVPAGWRVGSTWSPLSLREDGDLSRWRFVAQDWGHLQDSALVAGPGLRVMEGALSDGRALRVVLEGAALEGEVLVGMIERLVESQRRYLPAGWRWPRGTEVLTVLIAEGAEGVSEGTGRRGGAVLEVGRGVEDRALAELMAHEIFHAVNGHLLIHGEGREEETLWFKEGVTVWVSLLSVVRAGYADGAWFRARLAQVVSGYRESPLSSGLGAPSRLSSRAARRASYDKGALLGLLVDQALAGEGRSGLERLFGAMLPQAAEGRPYDDEALRGAALGLWSGEGAGGRFWERFVAGVEPLPLVAGLDGLGLGLVEQEVSAPYYGYGVEGWGKEVVSWVDPDGPAARGGLRVGDRIVARVGMEGGVARLSVRRASGWRGAVVVEAEAGRRPEVSLVPLGVEGPGWLER